eukprot:12700180-Ditylum_brightwellii.AAC.1
MFIGGSEEGAAAVKVFVAAIGAISAALDISLSSLYKEVILSVDIPDDIDAVQGPRRQRNEKNERQEKKQEAQPLNYHHFCFCM